MEFVSEQEKERSLLRKHWMLVAGILLAVISPLAVSQFEIPEKSSLGMTIGVLMCLGLLLIGIWVLELIATIAERDKTRYVTVTGQQANSPWDYLGCLFGWPIIGVALYGLYMIFFGESGS